MKFNQGYIYLGLTSLMFGTFEVTSKLIYGLEATQINCLRFCIGGLALLPFALLEIRRRKIRFRFKDIAYLAFLGVLFVPVSMLLYQIALARTTASLSVFIFSVNPVFISVFAMIILKERANRIMVAAIAVGVVGLAVIANPFTRNFNLYILVGVAGVAVFGFYSVLMRPVTARFGNLVTTTLVIVFGAAVLLAGLLLRGIPVFAGLDGWNIWPLLYLGVFCSGLTFVSYYKGMSLTSTNVGSIVFFLKPVLSTILAVIVLRETLTLRFLIGAGLIILGSVLMVYGRERFGAPAPGGRSKASLTPPRR
jgi:drug/metabolite transporter (DMT)-like permease